MGSVLADLRYAARQRMDGLIQDLRHAARALARRPGRRFGADPGVIGRPVTLDGESYTVVGVMPPGFGHPPRVELWAPLVLEGADATDARVRFIRMIGRLSRYTRIA